MNNLELKKTQILDYIGIGIFILILVFWCDLDIQGWLVMSGLNTNTRLGLLLCVLVLIGIVLYKYINRTWGVLLFVLLLLMTKVMLTYTELFTTTTGNVTIPQTTNPQTTNPQTTNPQTTNPQTTNPNIKPLSEFSGSADEVQTFLLRQIADDPNTTTVDKRVMADLTQKYFKTSSKLAELRGFNIASESANMLAGQQIIVGLDTVKNQH